MDSFGEIMREYMDYSDDLTVSAVAEAERTDNQSQLLTALTNKLYDLIKAKADKIDYSSVSRSRGNITKIDNYGQLIECLEVMHNIVVAYNQNTHAVDTISTAIDNLSARAHAFQKAFLINSPILVLTYNEIAMATVDSTSFMIATCIEFIKDPKIDSIDIALNTVAYNNSEKNLMFQSLNSFNNGCKSGDLDTCIEVLLNQSNAKYEAAEFVPAAAPKPFLDDDNEDTVAPELQSAPTSILPDTSTEKDAIDSDTIVQDDVEHEDGDAKSGSVMGAVGNAIGTYGPGVVKFMAKIPLAIAAVVKWLIPCIRDLTYKHYFSRQQKSVNYETQAELLEMNALKVLNNQNIDEEKRKKIYQKQMKIVMKWKAKANKYNIDNTTSDRLVKNTTSKEAQQFVIDDLDSSQTDYNSSIF